MRGAIEYEHSSRQTCAEAFLCNNADETECTSDKSVSVPYGGDNVTMSQTCNLENCPDINTSQRGAILKAGI